MHPNAITQCTWTPEQDAMLIDLRDNQGKTFAYIAARVGHGAKKCGARYNTITRRNPEPNGKAKDIPCIQCGDKFQSPDYKRIRRCQRCHRNTDEGAGIFATGAGFSGSGYRSTARRAE